MRASPKSVTVAMAAWCERQNHFKYKGYSRIDVRQGGARYCHGAV